MKKLLLLTAIAFFVLIPHTSHAQFDQRCWVKDDCVEARKFMLSLDGIGNLSDTQKKLLEEGFVQDNQSRAVCRGDKDAADRPVGFCMPATKAHTGISYGGKNTFDGIAQFIAFIYQYGIQIAGLLAIIMIIVAGVQWIISGGNTDSIAKAKKRIYGSIIGLILIATSYTILNVINPNLVNLRPPNVWMINTIGIAPTLCSELEDGSRISKEPAHETGKPLDEAQRDEKYRAISAWVPITSSSPEVALCGQEYFTEKGGHLTCSGSYCPDASNGKTQVCYDKFNTNTPGCYQGNITGIAYSSDIIANIISDAGGIVNTFASVFGGTPWEVPWINQPELEAICQNGEIKRVSTRSNTPDRHTFIRDGRQTNQYVIEFDDEAIDDAKEWCEKNNRGDLKGFVVNMDINREAWLVDEVHYLGKTKTPPHRALDLGDGDNPHKQCFFRNIPIENLLSLQDIGYGPGNDGINLDINVAEIFRTNYSSQSTFRGSSAAEAIRLRQEVYPNFAKDC